MRRIRCFHAGEQEYRCGSTSAGISLVIQTPEVTPDDAKAQIEDKCGELRKVATSPLCLKTIRFTPFSNTSDVVSGYQTRTIITTPVIEVVGGRHRR